MNNENIHVPELGDEYSSCLVFMFQIGVL